jgi:hypothetical protein
MFTASSDPAIHTQEYMKGSSIYALHYILIRHINFPNMNYGNYGTISYTPYGAFVLEEM